MGIAPKQAQRIPAIYTPVRLGEPPAGAMLSRRWPVLDRDGMLVANAKTERDALGVIRALNAHDDLLAALHAILNEPFGCRFCDSGKLRNPDNPEKTHDDDCAFLLAQAAIAKAES